MKIDRLFVVSLGAITGLASCSSGQEEEAKESYEIGDIRLYPKRRAAKLKDEDFALTPLEFDFLCHMLERKEHAASRDDLLKIPVEGGQQGSRHESCG